jgi:hypothetical protein
MVHAIIYIAAADLICPENDRALAELLGLVAWSRDPLGIPISEALCLPPCVAFICASMLVNAF